MNTCTTNGIKVSVSTRYEENHSNPRQSKFVHSYVITIENRGSHTVQLMSRHWVIVDADLNVREIKGEGVVGVQPVLNPGESHRYSSWCPLNTDIGKMYGSYQMINQEGDSFDVKVPTFLLCQRDRLN